jgi:hypothetical protein
MSKKAVRTQKYFIRNWTAAILASMALSGFQSVQAANEHRQQFRELRADSRIDRHTAKQMFRQLRHESLAARHNALVAPAAFNAASGSEQLGMNGSKHRTPAFHIDRDLGLQPISNRTVQIDNGRTIRLESGVNLDLGSTDKNISLGQKLFESVGSIEIQIGSEKRSLSAGAQVTAAEYVAVKQVLNGLGQKISLDANGTAVSGSVDLSALTINNDVMRASNLVVPQGVTTLGDFSKGSDFRLSGNLNNFGSIQTFDSDGRSRGGAIRADNIFNQQGASITSDVDLELAAHHDFSNQGTISSSANLNISTGGTLSNTGSLSSGKNIDLVASAVTNSGVVQSQTGNINVNSSADSTNALVIDNRGGTLAAQNGAINVRSADYTAVQDTWIVGGDLFSQQLNLNSGAGTANVNVNQLTGMVNSTGLAAHVTADTENLSIGSTCLTGDPTFFNTGVINIDGNITVNEALTIVSGSNININGGFDLAAGDANRGYPITLVAGAAFTNTGGANQGSIGPVPPIANNGAVTINGASASGGSIQVLAAGASISTRPFANGNLDGADVLLAAFQGAGVNSGRVIAGNNASITTGGFGFGNNGDVTVIAPSVNSVGTTMPAINTTGGTGFGGFVSAFAAQPIAINVVYQADGSLALGSPTIVPNSGPASGGEIEFFSTSVGNAGVSATADLTVSLNPLSTITARRVDFQSSGDIEVPGIIIASELINLGAQGNINTKVGANSGTLQAPDVALNSVNGSVGTSGGGLGIRFSDNVKTTVTASGALGVNLQPGLLGAVLDSGTVGTGKYEVQSLGPIDLFGNISVNSGNIEIVTDVAPITDSNGVTLSTNNGNIGLAILNPDKKLSKINLSTTTLTALGGAGLGNVVISLDDPGLETVGKAPKKNIIVDIQAGGQIFFGKKGFTANAPTSTLTAKGANITFHNLINKKNIVLSNVTILADPPAAN